MKEPWVVPAPAAPQRRCRPHREWPPRRSRHGCWWSHCADHLSLTPPRRQRQWRRAMFEKIAKFRLLRARRVAPDRSLAANDNRRGAERPGHRRPQLVCRWSFDQGPHCRWEIAGPQGGNPLPADEPPAGAHSHNCLRTVVRRAGRDRVGQRGLPLGRARAVAGTSL